MADTKRRNPNWSEEEKIILLEEYNKRKEILTARFSPKITSQTKHKMWQQITDAVNARNLTVNRTMLEVKKKYENLAVTAKKEVSYFKKESGKTGGYRNLLIAKLA